MITNGAPVTATAAAGAPFVIEYRPAHRSNHRRRTCLPLCQADIDRAHLVAVLRVDLGIKRHVLALLQRLKALGDNRGKMDEQVLAAVVILIKP